MNAVPENLKHARSFHEKGDLIEAEKIYQQVLETTSENAEALHTLGIIAYQTGRYVRAAQFIQSAVRIKPDCPRFHYNAGLIHVARKDLKSAMQSFQEAVRIQPVYEDAYFNMGLALKKQGRLEAAITHFRMALRFDPENSAAHYNLGNIYKILNQPDAAISHYQTAIRIKPHLKEAYNNLGLVFKEIGRVESAIPLYRQAIALNPHFAEAHWNLSIALLLTGRFHEGFREYEWRFLKTNREGTYPYVFDIPRWQGTSFKGKRLFVHSEQGLGDTIQFIRYLPMIKQMGGTVVFETFRPLIDLLKDFAAVDELVEISPHRNCAQGCDYFIPLMSLPGLLGTETETIPSQVPYIKAPPRQTKYWGPRLQTDHLKVGLVWSGKVNSNDNRPFSLESLMPLTQIRGVRFFGLQKGPTGSAFTALPHPPAVTNLGEALHDFSYTAGVIHHLDLVISIDTSVAHLAGAMGKPTWTLLPFVPDWRWLLDREDSPWYPTMKLFRQPAPGDWQSVFQRVAKELQEYVKTTHMRP